jgi:hypothetical protein
MEYMLNHAVLATLVELSAGDIPFGVKGTQPSLQLVAES